MPAPLAPWHRLVDHVRDGEYAHLTDEQQMWLIRATFPPPSPGEVWLYQWQRTKGRPFWLRVRLFFSQRFLRNTIERLRVDPGPWPT